LYLHRSGGLEVAVIPGCPATHELSPGAQFDAWVAASRAFVARPGQPLPLRPLEVPKPWGREIWFTGAERRGVCDFGFAGACTPQPWLLAALPDKPPDVCPSAPVLLKVLDPVAEPVRGDLYFELHDVKQEVYVVTHVDRGAWPDGVGYLRFGFCPQRLAASACEAEFRRDYLAAVQAYRDVREQIDTLPEGVEPEPGMLQREERLRSAMDAFTWLKPVRVGDVIEVPRLLPHALQHGVRVVEFQTPVFERRILSFAQRVPTQAYWDTEGAIDDMRLLPPPSSAIQLLAEGAAGRVEKVSDMPDFEVRRLRVEAGAVLPIEVPGSHGLALVLTGRVRLQDTLLGPEEAAWLPGQWRGELVVPEGAVAGELLLAVARP
jgi:hypothetical protein